MTVYLGSLGRMVELYTTPSASVVAEDRYSFSTTLEGRRKAQVRPASRRTWTLSAGMADAQEQATLMQFAHGDWGPGPFVYVSADAPRTNMLTPLGAASALLVTAGVAQGGPVLCSDGTWSPKSLLLNGASVAYFQSDRTPVLPGRPVTVSADVMGVGGRVSVSFFTAGGAFISVVSSPAGGVAGVMSRLSVTADAPATAAMALVGCQDAAQATRPALTWTSRPEVWADGQGCAKAVLHGVSRSLVQTGMNGTYSDLTFTVTEVG